MTDTRPPFSSSHAGPGMHHVGHDVAVANTGLDVVLTTVSATGRSASGCTATRLTPDRARAIGWALIEAAGHVDAGTAQPADA